MIPEYRGRLQIGVSTYLQVVLQPENLLVGREKYTGILTVMHRKIFPILMNLIVQPEKLTGRDRHPLTFLQQEYHPSV